MMNSQELLLSHCSRIESPINHDIDSWESQDPKRKICEHEGLTNVHSFPRASVRTELTKYQ